MIAVMLNPSRKQNCVQHGPWMGVCVEEGGGDPSNLLQLQWASQQYGSNPCWYNALGNPCMINALGKRILLWGCVCRCNYVTIHTLNEVVCATLSSRAIACSATRPEYQGFCWEKGVCVGNIFSTVPFRKALPLQ